MMRRIDLLPVAYVQRKRDRRNTTLVILVGLFVVLLLLAWYLLLRTQISTAENELEAVEQRNAALEVQIAELQQYAELDAEVKAKRTALNTVFAGDIDWPSVMTEIAMVVPGDIWLATMQASTSAGGGVVSTESSQIPLTTKPIVGRLAFTANSASCMPGVARWLIRLASVDEFDAAWIGSASEGDSRPGCEPPVGFDSTVELNTKALSHRFEGAFE